MNTTTTAPTDPNPPNDNPADPRTGATTAIAPKLAYSVEETAELLSIGTWLVYELIHTKQLASRKAGRRRLIPHASIERFLEAGDS